MKATDEIQLLKEVIEQYRAEGYDICPTPVPADLPPFLAGFSLDLLARKPGENVVVQIKNRQDLGQDARLAHLTAAVNAHPDWRLDLVVFNDKKWLDEMPPEAVEATPEDIRRMIEEARGLLDQQVHRSALLTGWAALEATMRDTARRLNIPLDRLYPRFILDTLVSEGVFSREEYDRLRSLLDLRNAAAHGLQTNGKMADGTRYLIELADRLHRGEGMLDS